MTDHFISHSIVWNGRGHGAGADGVESYMVRKTPRVENGLSGRDVRYIYDLINRLFQAITVTLEDGCW
jgi:hypothetical protein